jgi:cytoskeletal protein CcmA (bactofilin family)
MSDERLRRAEILKESAVTILTNGCHFKGKLFCRGSTRIGGRVEGEIVSEGLLIIEADAVITASIEADEVIIQGEINGRIEAKQRIELCPPSRVKGEIITSALIIKEGAQFNGTTTMKREASQEVRGIRSEAGALASIRAQEKVTDDVVVDLDTAAKMTDVKDVSVIA